jgi:hypothetical protein
MVVERKYGFYILPLSVFGSYTCTAILFGAIDHVVNLPKSFRIGQWLARESFCGVLDRLDLAYSMQPVFHSRSMYHIGEDALVGSFDKHEERGGVAISNFTSEADLGERADELLELLC